jgi:phenylacetate-coenzyme A ligase PaaK-like adenylate-forming protein
VALRFPPGSLLIHGGGWKKLQERKVSNEVFKAALRNTFGLERVHNYYGMVEQVGGIYFECEAGWLHTPSYADVIIRDRMTLAPLATGEEGLIQVLSVLPRSYPGHSLLTEDLGTIAGEDDCPCGRMGKRFSVSGRLPRAELRGCSDTRVTPQS